MALRIALLAAIAAALAAPTAATAGGWATVGFDPPPDGLAAGEPWQVEMTILQHGRAPLDGLKPQVIVRSDGGGGASFPARPTGKPGVYRATVVFESAGTWRYVVDDGFAARHSYPAVEVGNGGNTALTSGIGASGSDDGPDWLLAILVAAAAALVAGFGMAALQRRREGPSPTSG
jgi:hypothetical protein